MQKKVPYVAQLGNMDCSIACMTMLFRYYGLDVDIVDVGQVVHIGRDGVNLTQLKQATQQFGFKCTAYRYNKQKNILDSNLPAVVYSGSHLAVIGSKTVLGQYILLDPIKGKSNLRCTTKRRRLESGDRISSTGWFFSWCCRNSLCT